MVCTDPINFSSTSSIKAIVLLYIVCFKQLYLCEQFVILKSEWADKWFLFVAS